MIRCSGPRRPAAGAAVLALVATLAGCRADPPSNPSPTAPPVGHYELVDDLCDYVSLDAILEVLPVVTMEMSRLDVPIDHSRNCYGVVGLSDDPAEQGDLNVRIQVFESQAVAKETFEPFYEYTSEIASSAADIAGIGQQAYHYALPLGYPTVQVLDGNAIIIANWIPDAQLETPERLVDGLTETIRSTMASLNEA